MSLHSSSQYSSSMDNGELSWLSLYFYTTRFVVFIEDVSQILSEGKHLHKEADPVTIKILNPMKSLGFFEKRINSRAKTNICKQRYLRYHLTLIPFLLCVSTSCGLLGPGVFLLDELKIHDLISRCSES